MTVKDCEKFIIINYCDLKIISIALMSYQEFLSYAQCMMNMIFCSYKFFVCCYINDIIIFSKTLKNHLQHLNMIFNLFNRLEITLKKIKTHLNYLLIILLDQQVDDFDMTTLKKQITALQDLSFSEIFKDFKIYLNLIKWFYQYISYYAQQIELLQNRKTVLLHKNSTIRQTRKNYSKKTSISDVNKIEKEIFNFIQKIFNDFNFLHHQNFNWHLYINLNASKQHEFDVMIYHMQNDYNSSLDYTVKKNQQKIKSILFLSKLLTDVEIQY